MPAISNQDFFASVAEIENEIADLERTSGPFAPDLTNPLMELAEIQMTDGDFEGAVDTLHRAQNIMHRNEGVYTPAQLDIIRLMTNMALSDEDFDTANKQQRFAFFVSSRHLEESDPERLFAYAKLANWYMNTGQPRRARRLLQEAEAQADRLNANRLPLAIAINKARRLEGLSNNPRELLKVLAETEQSDPDTLATAYMEVADSLVLSRRDEQAAGYYARAFDVSPLTPTVDPRPITVRRSLDNRTQVTSKRYRLERDVFGQRRLEPMTPTEALEDLAVTPQWFIVDAEGEHMGFDQQDSNQVSNRDRETQRLIGHPILFSKEQLENLVPNRVMIRQSELQIEFSFTVTETGDLEDIEVVNSNAPAKLDRLVMDALRRVFYRPALDDGVPVARAGVRLVQRFDSVSKGV